MNRLAITKIEIGSNTYTAFLILDEKREVIDFQLYEPDSQSLLHNIYVAKVENIVTNIQAAFVRISEKQKCFLPLEDVKAPVYTNKRSNKKELCVGDELLVQITRDAVKTKDPVVSTKLTISGSYSVLTSENTHLGISKKLSDEKKKYFQELLENTLPSFDHRDYGIVVRTNAAFAAEQEFVEDLNTQIQCYQTICKTSAHKTPFTLVYHDEPGYLTRLKSISFSNVDYIYTDDIKIMSHIKDTLPRIADKVLLYDDDKLSLHSLYNIKGNLEKLLSNKVWLKSGANIIIESLETLTVIDVNTGKNIAQKQDVIFAVNKEAAIEIARQLRLRNISGMVIIDFINMKSKSDEEQLISLLKQEIAKDPVRCSFIDITKLGLVELTRKKLYRSLQETLKTSGKKL